MGKVARGEQIHILESNRRAKDAIETLSKTRKCGQRPAYTDYRLMAYRLAEYLHRQIEVEDKPITKTGIRMALLLPERTYYDYRDGNRDTDASTCTEDGTILLSREGDTTDIVDAYRQRDELQPYYHYLTGTYDDDTYIQYSQIIKNAEDFYNLQVENLGISRGNVFDIFSHKVHLGYQDETPQAPQTVNQTLIVSGDSADKALAHIGLKLIEE